MQIDDDVSLGSLRQIFKDPQSKTDFNETFINFKRLPWSSLASSVRSATRLRRQTVTMSGRTSKPGTRRRTRTSTAWCSGSRRQWRPANSKKTPKALLEVRGSLVYASIWSFYFFLQELISVCRVRASPQDPISVTGARVMEWSRGWLDSRML